jgi:transcription elongation factor Elf1
LYGGSLHPIADVGGDVVICDKCVQTLEHSFICPFCNEVNTLDIASEFAFDIHRLEASITCVGCVEQVSLDGLFNKNTIDVMISILMDSIKTKGEF